LTRPGASLDLGAPFERELAAQGVQTVSFDAPGIGQSTPYAWPRRMPGIARTVERMLDALGYPRVDVLGASLGGVIAQQVAHQAPHRVRRLVLAATGPGLGGIPGSPRALLSLATPRRCHQPGHYQRVAARIYDGASRRDPGSLPLALADELAGRPSLRGYLGQIYAISG
jgi:poly(3-hydroxyoctanoate) depolymerase